MRAADGSKKFVTTVDDDAAAADGGGGRGGAAGCGGGDAVVATASLFDLSLYVSQTRGRGARSASALESAAEHLAADTDEILHVFDAIEVVRGCGRRGWSRAVVVVWHRLAAATWRVRSATNVASDE